jgi:Ca2+-binding EF-hand superfamily protein
MNMADYAKKLVMKYDKNGDMMLQPEERKELTGRAAESDLNHDGVITIPELVSHLSDPTPSPAPSSSPGDSGRWGSYSRRHDGERHDGENGGDRSKSEADKALAGRVFTGTAGGMGSTTKLGDKRHSYRFSSAADREPGLPSELRSRDRNGDGQISMSEFSSYWDAGRVADFRRWDTNGDGIITAKEAAKRK